MGESVEHIVEMLDSMKELGNPIQPAFLTPTSKIVPNSEWSCLPETKNRDDRITSSFLIVYQVIPDHKLMHHAEIDPNAGPLSVPNVHWSFLRTTSTRGLHVIQSRNRC